MPGAPFTNVQSYLYWSSMEYYSGSGSAWYVYMDGGYVLYTTKSSGYYVWPVRGGQ
jgi:hypothetical protein